MSVAEYAKHRGCRLNSVSYALRMGHIKRTAGGWIDSEQADKDWARNVNSKLSESNKLNGKRSAELKQFREARAQGKPLPQAQAKPVPPVPAPVQEPAKPAPVEVPATPVEIQVFADARATKEQYNAMLAKLDYERKSGQYISRAEVQSATFQMWRVLRDSILAVPDRIASQLAAETDAKAVHAILLDDLRSVLSKVASMKPTSAQSLEGVDDEVACGNAG